MLFRASELILEDLACSWLRGTKTSLEFGPSEYRLHSYIFKQQMRFSAKLTVTEWYIRESAQEYWN